MLFTPHMLIGAAIGARVSNFGLAFFLSLVSHYLLDMLPHWEYEAAFIKKPVHVVRLTVDFLIGVSVVLFFLWQEIFAFDHRAFIILGSIFFAQLPDLFLFLQYNFNTKWTRSLVRIHHKVHNHGQYRFLEAPACAALIVVLLSALLLMGVWG